MIVSLPYSSSLSFHTTLVVWKWVPSDEHIHELDKPFNQKVAKVGGTYDLMVKANNLAKVSESILIYLINMGFVGHHNLTPWVKFLASWELLSLGKSGPKYAQLLALRCGGLTTFGNFRLSGLKSSGNYYKNSGAPLDIKVVKCLNYILNKGVLTSLTLVNSCLKLLVNHIAYASGYTMAGYVKLFPKLMGDLKAIALAHPSFKKGCVKKLCLLLPLGSVFAHDLISFLLLVVVIMTFFSVVVGLCMFYVLHSKSVSHYMGHKKSKAETLAFVFSSLALLLMAKPSMSLLYQYSSQINVGLIVKVVASQWYWSFEVSNVIEDSVPMYILPLDELSVGDHRLLEVDNRLVIPTGVLVQFNITSSDVIHSFALPTLGVKVDATSGLLTVAPLFTKKVGVHYGQCSEICGINHAFIPFSVEVTTIPSFLFWVIVQ